MLPELRLTQITPDDVRRMEEWLRDPEVNSSWYGANESGEPMHIGYSPARMLKADSEEWDAMFNGETRKVYSVVTADDQHIGEVQMVIESPLREAQLFVLIGEKDLWYRGYGTAALVHLLDLAFYTYGLHRAWVDVPEYNLPAIHMCERAGFILEGRLRGSHPKDGQWYDSLAMGLLSNEYARRRAHLLEAVERPTP